MNATKTVPREFTEADVTIVCPNGTREPGHYARISTGNFRDELKYAPPDWMKRGLQETATGYGKRLNSGYMIHFNGKRYRVYVTCFSNAGTAWFKAGGRRIIVS